MITGTKSCFSHGPHAKQGGMGKEPHLSKRPRGPLKVGGVSSIKLRPGGLAGKMVNEDDLEKVKSGNQAQVGNIDKLMVV
jgi:hypothetical protein